MFKIFVFLLADENEAGKGYAFMITVIRGSHVTLLRAEEQMGLWDKPLQKEPVRKGVLPGPCWAHPAAQLYGVR